MGRPRVARPSNKHVGLGLTWLDVETSAVVRLELWGVLGRYKCIGYDASDKAVGIEAEIEIDVWRLRYVIAKRSDCIW